MIHYEVGKTYRNRHGEQFYFKKEPDGSFSIKGQLSYWRFGGQDYQQGLDYSNLGYVDPSGGPFLSAADFSIDGKVVRRIACVQKEVGVEFDLTDNGLRFYTEV